MAVATLPVLWAVTAAWGTAALIMPFLWRSQRLYGPSTRNYAGHPVAASAGIILPLAYGAGCVAAFWAAAIAGPRPPAGTGPGLLPAMQAMLLVITSSALWGLLDDAAGGQGPRGWRGHWRSLLQGRWSTGVFKGVGTVGAALTAAALLGLPWPWWPPAALVMALTANTVNLLDLRPGRALKGFWLGTLLVVAAGAGPGTGTPWAAGALLPLMAVTAAYAPWDFSRRVMLGDSGANALGGALGLAAVAGLWPRGPLTLAAAALLLLALQWLGETRSWSTAFAQVPFLNVIDNLGRRETPGPAGKGKALANSAKEDARGST